MPGLRYFVFLIAAAVLFLTGPSSAIAQDNKPNILLIVADDLGWSDIGSFGSEIDTPALDALAAEGVKFTDFHASISCSPTRSMLLSGTDNHIAGLGNMGELLSDNQKGKPGYEGHLNDRVVSLAEVLKAGGYHTYMAGKWHLGHDDDQLPFARGFERTLSLINGGASHYNDMTGLMEVEDPVHYSGDGKKLDKLPADFFSTRSYTDFLIDAIRQNRDDGKPFLAYLAFTAPHDPLHVPEPWLSKYRGRYDDGYEVLHKQRVEAGKKLGLIPQDVSMPRMDPQVKPWTSLSAEKRALEARGMETYAGMVDNMDYHIGRMISFLKDIGEYDNTIVIFMSDNGANPWYSEQYPGNAEGDWFKRFDNSVDNIGNPGSAYAYGIGFSSASSGPFDRFKLTVSEGGIRTPLVIAGPGVKGGRMSTAFVYVTDLMPTLLEMTGLDHPGTFDGKPVEPMRGRSLAGLLAGSADRVYGPDDYIAGELTNGKWIRQGDYKAVSVTPPYGKGEWHLYDLAKDPGETTDLARSQPDILKRLVQEWDKYAEDVGVVPWEPAH